MAVYLVPLSTGFKGDPVAHGGELVDVYPNALPTAVRPTAAVRFELRPTRQL